MATIKAFAHLNELTKDVTNDYYLTPEDVSPNTNTKLQFTLPPEVTAGKWSVQIVSQASGNSKQFMKEPRTAIYSSEITVI